MSFHASHEIDHEWMGEKTKNILALLLQHAWM